MVALLVRIAALTVPLNLLSAIYIIWIGQLLRIPTLAQAIASAGVGFALGLIVLRLFIPWRWPHAH